MTTKAATVLTLVLLSTLANAANIKPLMFESTASANWHVAAIALRSSARAPSSDKAEAHECHPRGGL